MGSQVDARGIGETVEMLGEPGFGEPWLEESGGLRALTGRDDDDSHGFHPAVLRASASNCAHEKSGKSLGESHKRADFAGPLLTIHNVMEHNDYERREHRARSVRSPLPPSLTDSTGFLLGWVASHASERFAAALAEVGLTPHQLGVLTVLTDGPQKQARISEQLKVFQPVMVTLVNELESAGLVRREPHPDDRRALQIHLEPAGAERLAAAQRALDAATEDIFGALSAEDRAHLHRTLLEMVHHLDPRQES